MWRNWAGDQRCAPAAIERPGERARRSPRRSSAPRPPAQRVRVVGSGHSFTDAACTDGRLLSLERMDRVLDVDRASGRVRVEGGITIHALSAALATHGLALENLGDIDAQTIAGAISTATHGTGARLRNISAQVERSSSCWRTARRSTCSAGDEDPTAYLAARVGVGSLGVIAAVTLRAVPAFTLRGVDKPAPLGETLERLERAGGGERPLRAVRLPALRHRAHAHEQPRRGAAAAALARARLRAGRAADEPRVPRLLPRGARAPALDPAAQPRCHAAGGSERAGRPQRPHLRLAAARQIHGDGVRAAARAHGRGGAARDRADPARAASCAVPDRGAARRARTTRC